MSAADHAISAARKPPTTCLRRNAGGGTIPSTPRAPDNAPPSAPSGPPFSRASRGNMIGTETLGRVIGQDVYDQDGDKIGSASEIYLDDETGQPEWITLRTGLFGTKESFVP